MTVPLTAAVGAYDQVRDLAAPEGVDLTVLTFTKIEELFHRFLDVGEFDVAELSLAVYCALVSQGRDDFVAIPAFPARSFRHSAIYVRAGGPVREPADLRGRTVGVPVWAQTAGVWARGLLVHEYGLELAEIAWRREREEPAEVDLPPGIVVEPAERGLDELLLDGEVDAVICARPPASFVQENPAVRRLFDDVEAVEAEYYERTGIFPIMHVVALRREVHDEHPGLAAQLLAAFEDAKCRSLARALEGTIPSYPLPWAASHARAARALFGDDFWPYGVDANRTTLETFLAYAFEQGVCRRPLAVEELF
jgi:4,5-dihydroxyphthalate decarboxylase